MITPRSVRLGLLEEEVETVPVLEFDLLWCWAQCAESYSKVEEFLSEFAVVIGTTGQDRSVVMLESLGNSLQK